MSEGSNAPAIITIAERIIRLEKNRAEIDEAIKDIYTEARSVGYDQKVLKRAIKFASLAENDRKKILAENEMFDLYVEQIALPL